MFFEPSPIIDVPFECKRDDDVPGPVMHDAQDDGGGDPVGAGEGSTGHGQVDVLDVLGQRSGESQGKLSIW